MIKYSFRKTIAVAGTAEVLGPSMLCSLVEIQSLPSNTGRVAIGPSPYLYVEEIKSTQLPPSANSSSYRGTILRAGEIYTFGVSNLSDLWFDAAVANEGISVMVFS